MACKIEIVKEIDWVVQTDWFVSLFFFISRLKKKLVSMVCFSVFLPNKLLFSTWLPQLKPSSNK